MPKSAPSPHPPSASAPPTAPAAVAPPPTWRDPWAWATVLAVLPLAWAMRGALQAEPVADDFDMLYRGFFTGVGSLLDGGGTQAFWRPIPQQLYYGTLAPLLLSHPAVVALLHIGLLALGSLVLYRTLRPSWSGGLAAAAASFPLLAESVRTIAGWAAYFVDIGLFVCVALALHEASRRRLGTALAALLGALLCKESAVVAAVMLPWVPAARPLADGERRRWAVATAAVTLGWGLVYLWVRRSAHLELPHGMEHDSALLGTPLGVRLGWAFVGSLKALASLTLVAGPRDGAVLAGVTALFVLAFARLAARSAARARLRRMRGWIGFGLAWFVLATLVLTTIFPMWEPKRSQFGGVGLGIAAVGLLGAAHPALAGALVVGRLALLGLAPGAASGVSTEPPVSGAFMDFARLTRLQRLMRVTRQALRERHPTLPHGAVLVGQNLPHAAEYALGGDQALRLWYRDSTLRWMRFEEFRRHSELPVADILMFQTELRPEVVLIDPDAVRAQFQGFALLQRGRWAEALAQYDRADSLIGDRRALVLLGRLDSERSYCLIQLGRPSEAEGVSRRGLGRWPAEPFTRLTLAMALAEQRRWSDAEVQLDSLLAREPGYPDALDLRARIAAARGAPAAAPSRGRR